MPDWFNEVFKTGVRQNHNVNLSGGGANNTYNIGLDYFSQKGTLEGAGPNFERFTARVNNTMDVKFVKFRTSLVYSHSDQDNMAISNANEYVQGLYGDVSNVLRSTLLMQPTIKAYNNSTWVLDGTVGAANSFRYDAYGYGVYYDNIHGDISASNPLLVNNLMERNTLVDRFVGTASADVDLLDMLGIKSKNHKLNYKINLSYSKTHAQDHTWIPAWIQSNRVYLDKSNERLTKKSRTYADALIENILTYDGTFGKHHVNLVAGQTYEEENSNTLTGWGINLSEPYYLQLQNSKTTHSESSETKHALASYIGRLNYDFDGKYLISGVIRRDGSSRLSKNIRWETFPSVSAGWRFDKESFFPISHDIINMFKVRGSYGVLGNENIGEYQFQGTMNRNNLVYNFGNNVVYGSAVSNFINENIAWEKKKSTNVGIDLALFNNRLEFTAEWYKNVSEENLNMRNADNKKFLNSVFDDYLNFSVNLLDEIIRKGLENRYECKRSMPSFDFMYQFLLKNWYGISYKLQYQGDSFTEMSEGKKAFVILKLLLDFSDKTCPILIDQPEDSLDNRAIYKELVSYIKRKKGSKGCNRSRL